MPCRSIVVIVPGIYAILMTSIMTCIFTRAFTDIHTSLLNPLSSFDYPKTYVELYLLVVIDAGLLLVASLIIRCCSCRTRKYTPYLRWALVLFQLLLYGYSLSKFLVFYEWRTVRNPTSPYQFDRFDILAMVFTPLLALGTIPIWIWMFKQAKTRTLPRRAEPERQHLLDGTVNRSYTDENDPLLVTVEGASPRATQDEKPSQDLPTQIKETSGSWWRILKLGRDEWQLYIVAFAFLLIAASTEILQPLFSGHIISSVVAGNWQSFTKNVFWFLGVSVVYVISSGLRGFIFSITSTNLIQRLRNTLFARIVKQDIAFFDQTKTGEITSRLSSDITTVGEAVSINLNIFLRSMVQTVGTIVMMVVLSWNLFLLTLITGPLAFGTAKLYGDLIANQQKKVQDALAEANSLVEEAISTIRTVKSFANEDEEIRLFKLKNDVVRKYSIRQALYYFGYMWNGQILIVLLNLGTLAYGGHLAMHNCLSIANFVAFILYQQRLGDVLDSINSVYTGLMKASGASIKLFEYIDRIPSILNSGVEKPVDFQGRVEFRNVSFSFPNRKHDKVLKNISFTVQPGQQVALVGPSGSGKTTCISLLEHFYDADEGEILIDDIPVRDFDYHYYHQKVSLVSQEPVLHARSIRDNIEYGLMEKQSQERIEAVSKMANAHAFISHFETGYDTECGERGVQMAGGQKQRIALARALIRSPKVLLLDEATSALDAEAEAQVQEAIARTVIGRTVLIIAHRLSTIRHADKILVLQHGEIVEEGSHVELIARRGLYYQLVRRQTEQMENEKKIQLIETNSTTIAMDVPLTEKTYSTSFNTKESF